MIRRVTRLLGGFLFGMALPGTYAATSIVWFMVLLIGVLIVMIGERIHAIHADDQKDRSEFDGDYDALNEQRQFNEAYQRELDKAAGKARDLWKLRQHL